MATGARSSRIPSWPPPSSTASCTPRPPSIFAARVIACTKSATRGSCLTCRVVRPRRRVSPTSPDRTFELGIFNLIILGNFKLILTPGATVVIPFEGTGARVIHSKGPEGGLFNLQVDSGSILTADSFAEHYSYGHFASIEGLAPGLHTLTVTNGTGAIWIEAVQFQEPVGSVVALLA